MPLRNLYRANRRGELLLGVRAWVLLLFVSAGLRTSGLLSVWKVIQRQFRARPGELPIDPAEFKRLARIVASAARYHLPTPKCLPRSLALAWLLARRGVAVELRLGTRQRHGQFEAHAWVEYAGNPVSPDGVAEHFGVLESPRLRLRTGD